MGGGETLCRRLFFKTIKVIHRKGRKNLVVDSRGTSDPRVSCWRISEKNELGIRGPVPGHSPGLRAGRLLSEEKTESEFSSSTRTAFGWPGT